MGLELKNYDPALMYGANVGVSVDLTDITDMNGNEVLEIDGVTSAVNFLRATNAATGNPAELTAQGDDTNVGLTLKSKATGAVILDSGTTGTVDIGSGSSAKTITIGNTTGATAVAIKSGTGGTIVTSADADALTVGANGVTNPVLKVDGSTASVATGLSVTGAAAASGLAVAVISSGTNENLTIDAKGSGTISLNVTGTGNIVLGRAATGVSTSLTGGDTLKNATAVPATAGAVAAGVPITMYSTSITVEVTSDTPTHTRPKGSLCINTGGSSTSTRMYVNTDGAGTWASFTTSA